jgi:hypothetical protein
MIVVGLSKSVKGLKTKNGPEGPSVLPVDCKFGPCSASVESDIGERLMGCKNL